MAGALCLLAGLLSACGKEPVSIDQVTISAADEARCVALVSSLPATLDGQNRRKVAPAAALGAAWGDPAIVLTCGGPDTVPRGAACQLVDGVGWYVPEGAFADQSLALDMTTIGLRPVVHLHVPAAYRPPPAILVPLAPLLTRTLKKTTGCQ